MKILHIGKFFPPDHGGMETFLADLVMAQREVGVEAHALVHGLPRTEDPAWLHRVEVQATLLGAPIALRFRSALSQIIRRVRPQLLHLHLPNNSAFWALTLPEARDTPWVVHWHADATASQVSKAVAFAYQIYRPFEQTLLRRAIRIVVTSPPYLASSVPLRPWREKSIVIPLGLPSQSVRLASTAVPHPKDWSGNNFRLLSLGRLVNYKGFETLLHAVADMPNVELLVAGDGPLMPELRSLVQRLTPSGQQSNITLLGRVTEEQKAWLMDRCELFCLASCKRTEAFGIVLLEAMSHGKPCLVSKLEGSGMPWLMTETKAGDIVEELHNPGAWRNAITKLQNDQKRRYRLGMSGQNAVRTRFSIESCSQQILERVYDLSVA